MRGRKELPLGAGGVPIRPLGATVRGWRKHRQMSLTALAIKAGLGPNGRGYLSKIEHGSIRHPSEALLGQIAEALGVSLSRLLLHRQPKGAAGEELGESGAEQSTESAWSELGSAREFAESIEQLERKVDRFVEVLAGLELDRAVREYETALARRDLEPAASHFGAAMALLDVLPESAPNRARRLGLLARHGQVANLLMQFPAYYDLLSRFEPAARELGQPGPLGALLANKAWAEWALGRFDQSIASATEAAPLGRAANDPSITGPAYVAQLWSYLYRGDLARVPDFQQDVITEGAMAIEYLWGFLAATGCANAYAWLGDWAAALRQIERADLWATSHNDSSMATMAGWFRCLILTYQGDLDGALAAGGRAVQNAKAPVEALWARGHLACAQVRAGLLGPGIATLAEDLPRLRAARYLGGEYWALFLAEGYWRAGESALAQQVLEEHLAIAERCGMRFCIGAAHRLLGELALEAGPSPATAELAEAHFEQSIAVLSEIGAHSELAPAYAGFGRLLERRGDSARAEKVFAQALELFARLDAPTEVASIERALAALRGE